MSAPLARRIIRAAAAGTVALAASATLLLAPTSADAGHSLRAKAATGHSLGHSL